MKSQLPRTPRTVRVETGKNPVLLKPSCHVPQPSAMEYTLLLFASAFLIVVYYWPVFASGFDVLIGDDADSRLNLLLADSWRDFFNGRLSFVDLRTFYPLPWARSGTDLNLTLYLLELPFRTCGLDFMQAATVVYVFLHWQCVICTYVVTRRDLSLPIAPSVICTTLVAFSNAFHEKLPHTQFYFLLLAPLLFLCILRYFRYYHLHQRLHRIGYGIASLLVFSAILYSSFYPGFFIALFGCIYFVCLLVFRSSRRFVFRFIRQRDFELVMLGVLGILFLVPFIYVYLPGIGNGWPEKTLFEGLPRVTDMLRIGNGNLLWSRPLNLILKGLGQKESIPEHTYGLPLMTFVLTLWCFVDIIRTYIQRKKRISVMVSALAWSLVVIWLVTLRIGSFSLWTYACHIIPGTASIRCMSRLYVLLTYPAALFCAIMLTMKAVQSKRWFTITLALIPLLLIDNFNVASICNNTRSRMRERIQNVPSPPADAQLFVIMPQAGSLPDEKEFPEHPWVEYGLLAMEIAQRESLFTFNGFTGKVVNEEWIFYNPYGRYYAAYVDEWINSRDVKLPVYEYEPRQRIWRRHVAAKPNSD